MVHLTKAQATELGIVVPADKPKEPRGMNRLERRYANALDYRMGGGEIKAWWFERIKLKLADNTHYTPDFMVLLADGTIEMHEVKGFWRDDARVKIKVAATVFPVFQFMGVTFHRARGWEYEPIKRAA